MRDKFRPLKWEIPPEKFWDKISDYFTRHDELLCLIGRILIDIDSKLDKITPITIREEIPRESIKKEITEIIKEVTKNISTGGTQILNDYTVIDVDLSKARTDEPVGLNGDTYTSMTVVKADAPVYIKINSKKAKKFVAREGFTMANFEIGEIYVTNDEYPSGYKLEIWLGRRV